MKDSLNTLKELASSVRNATKEGENSAERIGRLFEGILEYIKTPESIENYFELKQDSNGLDYIYTKYNIASAGALSMYASDKINVPSIYDGLPIDNDTIYWHEVDGSKVLKAKGGGGEAGSVQWDNISGKPSWIEDTKPSYSWSDITGEKPFYTKEEIASKYVTIDTEQEITALKHFTAGLSVGESKKKIYEENGVVYIDADVAVTGAMTFYASAGRSVSTIMDGVTVDEETITKGSDNVLRIKNAGAGSSFDENAMWSALSGSSDNQINKSHLTNALAGYATESWVTGKGYATESWVASKNYATTEALNAVSNKLNDFLEGSDADTIINKWKELEAFLSGMAETDNLAEILETKADKKYVDSTFVTLATKQTITGEKTFSSVLNTAAIKASGAITAPSLAVSDWVTIAGIKLRKLEDGALMLEGNLALTGALTMYASNGQSFDTIYDGLPIDNDTIYWQEVDGSRVLKAREGSGSSFDKSAMWTALAGSTTEQINKSHLTTALTGYATESWVSGKNYAVKATTLAGYGITDGINAVSVTGTGNAVTAASISGHTLTLTKGSTFLLSSQYTASDILAKLKTVDGSGSGLDADMLNGYKRVHTTDSNNKAYYRLLTLEIKGGYTNTPVTFELCGRSSTKTCFVSISFNNGATNDPSLEGFYYFGDNRYGRYLRLYKTATSTWELWMKQREEGYDGCDVYNIKPTSNILITINSGGSDSLPTSSTYKDCELGLIYGNLSGNAETATKLHTARTLWGQSFNGTKNVSGDLNYVGNINFTLKGRLVSNSSLELSCKNDDTTSLTFTGTVFRPFTSAHNNIDLGASTVRWRDLYIGRNAYVDGITKTGDFYIGGIRLHKTADGVITLEGNLAVTGGITTYAIDPVSASTIMDGVVVDGVTIKKENGKLVAVGGGEAGSVAWGNISGKPSVFATNIANITDLHSSWDSVLAAQKPAWLTAVSIATISDLHANWDALLKAAPSAYVTRWPTISEVTGKQNLVVKLNGGTTEGTNQFTYNATGTKTINITPAGIGAYTKSESDSKYPTKTGSGASGTWGIDISGKASDADKLDGYYETDFFRARDYISYSILENFVSRKSGTYNVGYGGYSGLLTVFYFGAGSTSAMEILAPYYDPSRGLQLRYAVDNNRFTSWRSFAFEDGNIASATKLQTTRKLWGRPFDGTDDVIGDMTIGGNISSVGYINSGFRVDYENDKVGLRWAGVHHVEFGGNTGFAHTTYFFHPSYSSSGSTQATIVIENASASNTPTFTTTHSFNASGVGYHKYGLGVGREAPKDGYAGGIYAGTILANNWFRSEGSTGWLNQTYGGGWYMSDANFIRTLGEKSVYLGNGSYRNAGGEYAANNTNNASEVFSCRFMSESIAGIPAGNIRNILGWYDSAASGWTTSYIIGSKRNYNNDWGEMTFGVYRYEGSNRSMRMFMTLDGAGQKLYIEGNILATGGSSFYGSDIRYKSIIHPVMLLALNKIAEAPSFVYRWNRPNMNQSRLNLGGSAQYTQLILPWAVEENDNFLSMDYATVAYTFAVHTARHLLTYETRTDKKIKKLEREIVILKKQLKKLGYEEVRTLDDQSV